MRIRKIGVVGAGTMGSGIAALAASAGVPAVLLDVPGEQERNEPARKGLERALKAKPAAFMDPARAALVEIGNTEDDFDQLAGCDWVVEVIIEKPEPKQQLFARLEQVLRADAIVTTNTSGIPMRLLTQDRGERFRRRFLGTHFFNPPRYLHLLELIPTPDTAPEVLQEVTRFGERILGKGIVLAKDAPGFIANRIGVYGIVEALRQLQEHGLTLDEVDVLTGELVGRPKSATFRTADLTGLDVLGHVVAGIAQATGEPLELPGWVSALVQQGRLGEKTGGGFYRKEGKQILTFDWRSGEYRPQQKPEIPGLEALRRAPLPERLRGVLELPEPYGAFARGLFAAVSHYVLERTPELAYDLQSVDRALEWGYGWELGPYRQMDAVGLEHVRTLFRDAELPEPTLLRQARDAFYQVVDAVPSALSLSGGYASLPQRAGAVSVPALRQAGRILHEEKDAALYDLGDGVALLEFRSKMGTFTDGVMKGIAAALELIEREGRAGLVVGHEDARTFSAGANLMMVLGAVQQGQWVLLEQTVRAFQAMTMSLRQAPFPVVVAPFGLTLGGGTELALHADRVQAHAELYMGLVEVGVGVIPGGGGTKEMLFRFMEELAPYPEADPFEAVKRAFGLIAMATTSSSALEARKLGFLRPADHISRSREHLLADAKLRVLDLAPDYVAPAPRTVIALGRQALGNLRYGIWGMREANQITDHEVTIASELAYVLCGGDGAPRPVTEQDVLDLEREAFLRLLGTEKTQERIAAMLKTGKALRN